MVYVPPFADFGKMFFLIVLRDIIESWIIAFQISTAITICFAVNNCQSFYVSERYSCFYASNMIQ